MEHPVIIISLLLAISLSTLCSGKEQREVIVSHTDENNILQLFRMKEDGSDSRQLTHGAEYCVQPACSADGKKIVFVKRSHQGMALWLCDRDGENAKELTTKSKHILVPSWLPDSKHIVWMSAQPGQKQQDPARDSQIHIMNTDTGESRRLFTDPEQTKFSNGMPVVSPRGDRIAFVSNRGGQMRIWTSKLDGSDARAVSPVSNEFDKALELPIEQKVPAWSPDGQWIAHWEGVEMIHMSKFTGIQDREKDRRISQTWNVWVVGHDGNNKRKIGRGDDPTWSPDGFVTRAFPAPSRGGPKVVIETESGEKELEIVPRKRKWGRFAWLPDPSWTRHEIYSGAHVNSATAADYDSDGDQEIIFSADGQILMYHGPNYRTKQILATSDPIHPKLKARCIHSTLHDVDGDGDLDFVGSYVRGLFWLECPNKNAINTSWEYHKITDDIHGVHCIRSFDIDGDGSEDLIANDFTHEEGPYSGSICWFKPTLSEDAPITWSIIPIADGTAIGGSHYFDFGDINGDGRVDFTLGAKGKPFDGGNYFAVFYAPADPTQPWRRESLPDAGKQIGATHASPADVNGDGKMDVIATRGHGVGALWFEAPDWTQHIIDDSIASPHSTDVGDIDGDGDIDFTTVGFESKLAAWYENDGAGNFTRHILSRDQMAYDTMITDLDGDGDNDILVAGQRSQNVVWFENPQR
ncbi:LpqB family beta-propeller domain-containing protein [Pelagicoccus mobilis]|uniref:PD40 domain-containing protein n=1 Tax=Pelagicoccus mobilis TaxID=415221 RepID=A0A934S3M5_9BACT|nr:LpqB family beta-propeller domain-containing protein [Pelagicoccus mobilis]MBK1880484.1 PD40 domain-containing protein [Pelagicoccus mobilis]